MLHRCRSAGKGCPKLSPCLWRSSKVTWTWSWAQPCWSRGLDQMASSSLCQPPPVCDAAKVAGYVVVAERWICTMSLLLLCLGKNLFHEADSEGPSARAGRTSLEKCFSVFLWFHSHWLLIFRRWLPRSEARGFPECTHLMLCNTLRSAAPGGKTRLL